MTVSLLDGALSRIPDVPGHDVRGMLLSGKGSLPKPMRRTSHTFPIISALN